MRRIHIQMHKQVLPIFLLFSQRHSVSSIYHLFTVPYLCYSYSALPRPKQYLHCTQDLLGVFGLLPIYDKHVRPHLRSLPDQDQTKSKGKEKEQESLVVPRDKDGEEEIEGGEKKKKKDNYKHLIKGIPGALRIHNLAIHTGSKLSFSPGKHPMKKDQYFQDLLKAPPKQKAHIQPFDFKTLREGFYVTPNGLPTYNKASIEGADPKEKEAKRLKVPTYFFLSFLFYLIHFGSGNAGGPKRKSGRNCNNNNRLKRLAQQLQHPPLLRRRRLVQLAHLVQSPVN